MNIFDNMCGEQAHECLLCTEGVYRGLEIVHAEAKDGTCVSIRI